MTGMPVSHNASQERLTANTEDDGRSTVVDGEDIGRYVKKRLMCADILVNDIDYDTSTSFDIEGSYTPLGSIGSLYDILQDNNNNYKYNNLLQDQSPRSVKTPPTQISHLLSVPSSPTSPKRPSPLLLSRQWRKNKNNGRPVPPPVKPKPLRKNKQTTSTTDTVVPTTGVSKVHTTDSETVTGAVSSYKDLSSTGPPLIPIKKQSTKPTPPSSPPLYQAVTLQPLSLTSSIHESSRERPLDPLPPGRSVPLTNNKPVLVPVKFSSPKRSSGDPVKTTRGSVQNRTTQRLNNFTGEFNYSQESDV